MGEYNTWSTGIAFWKSDFDKLELNEVNDLFPHTNILFGINNKNKYIVDNNILLYEIPIDHANKGRYDLFQAFAVEFNEITGALVTQKLITKRTYNHVRKRLLVFCSGLYYMFVVCKQPCSYIIQNVKESISKYSSYSLFKYYVFVLKTKGFIKKLIKR